MDVVSLCPLRVAAVVWQPRAGAFALTVACKATYRLEPISSPLADEQDEVHEIDQHWDDDDARSVSIAGDLAPFKRRTDVMLVGSAFAPGGAPARSLVARIQLGDVDKAIEVWADRALTYDGRLIDGPRFTKMSLRWERAAGGPSTSNPVGMRFDAPPSAEGRVAVPNLQPAGKTIARLGDTFEPVGFGPVAPSWPGRAWLLHQHAASWSHQRWFERPLPHDVDPRYFNAAPPDQQTDPLPPDARLLLENLHPAHARLVTNLVPVRPRAVIERPGRPPEPLELACDTVFIDTDRGVCTLTFRGRAQLAHAGESGRVAVTLEGSEPAGLAAPITVVPPPATAPITIAPPPEVASLPPLRFAPPKAPRQRSATLDGALPIAAKASALPFMPTKVGAAPDAARVQAFSGLPFRKTEKTEARLFDGEDRTGVFPELAPKLGPVPFGANAPASDEPTGAFDVEAMRRERAALPFAEGPAIPPPAAAMPPRVPSLGTIPPPALTPGQDVSPPFWRRITSTPDEEQAELLDAEILDADEAEAEPPEADTVRPPAAPLASAVLPAMSFLAPRVPHFGDVPATIEPVARPEPAPETPPEDEAEPLDVDVYAIVKVAFWSEGEGSRAAIEETVRDLGLDEDAFRAGEERLLEALAAEAREGHATLARELRAAMKRALRAAAERAGEAPGRTAGS